MRALLAAGLVVLLAGCSTLESINPFAKPKGPQPAPLPQLSSPRPVRLLWSASVGRADRYVFSPAVVAGALFAAGHDGSVARFDLASGREAWRARAEKRLSAGVGADETTVAVATDEGEVIALDAASGKVRWRARVSSEVLAAPAVGEGLVIVRSIDSRVFAFDETDGKRRWVYQRAAASLMMRAPAGINLQADTAFVGFSGGRLVALALDNGGVRWEASVANPKGATELERMTDVLGTPAVQARQVCAAAYQGRIACFDGVSGRGLWAHDFSTVSGVSTDASYAFSTDDRGVVQAFDLSSGRPVWKQAKLTYRQVTLPEPFGNTVAVGDFEGYVHFLDRDSGAFVARYATGRGAVRADPLSTPEALIVQTANGGLFALGL